MLGVVVSVLECEVTTMFSLSVGGLCYVTTMFLLGVGVLLCIFFKVKTSLGGLGTLKAFFEMGKTYKLVTVSCNSNL